MLGDVTHPKSNVPTVQHKAEVPPVFLGYNRLQSETAHVPLFQVATAVMQVMGNTDTLDAVQPMRYGWYIYMCMMTDRSTLIAKGINLNGHYITLQSEVRSNQKNTVKVTLKDLPLHSVLNEDVLDAMKTHCEVHLEVKYSNLWHEGKATTIWNGDRYLYVTLSDAQKLPQTIDVLTYKARVFKPLSVTKCKRCGVEGHCPSDDKCPAKAPVELQDTVEPFCGGKCVLSKIFFKIMQFKGKKTLF